MAHYQHLRPMSTVLVSAFAVFLLVVVVGMTWHAVGMRWRPLGTVPYARRYGNGKETP